MKKKAEEQKAARRLRAEGRSLRQIAREVGVSLSSASVWVRDVPVPPASPTPAAPPAAEGCEGEIPKRRCGKCARALPVTAFNRRGDDFQWWCRDCFRTYFKERGELHRQQSAASFRRRKQRARATVNEYVANRPCSDCGERDHTVFEFDHIGVKKAAVAQFVVDGAKPETIMREIQACDLVCANCHRRRTGERAGWRRAQTRWWHTEPPRSYAVARNFAYVYSLLERSACVDCGHDDICVLEFDHVGTKHSSVSRMAQNEASLDRLIAEIGQCEIRCANCHRHRTVERRASSTRG